MATFAPGLRRLSTLYVVCVTALDRTPRRTLLTIRTCRGSNTRVTISAAVFLIVELNHIAVTCWLKAHACPTVMVVEFPVPSPPILGSPSTCDSRSPDPCELYHTPLAPIRPHSYLLSLSLPSGGGPFKLIPFFAMSTDVPDTSFSSPVLSLENLLFDYPAADIILRSGDSHEFRVLRIYIIHSSPVLSDRVKGTPHPQPGATTSADMAVAPLPIVQLSDSGAVLLSLLTYIFPVQPILPSDIEDTIKLLSAAQSYRMDAVLSHIRNHMAQQDPPFIREENSLLAFSLAQKHGLRREAFQAALSTLKLPTFAIESLEERLETMPCASLYALWQYRQRIRNKFMPLVREDIPSNQESPQGSGSSRCTHLAGSGVPNWLDRYISSIESNPSFLSLSRFHMASRDHVRSSSKVNGSKCFRCATMDIPELWAALNDSSITEVS
jgi:hypothetical protein